MTVMLCFRKRTKLSLIVNFYLVVEPKPLLIFFPLLLFFLFLLEIEWQEYAFGSRREKVFYARKPLFLLRREGQSGMSLTSG
jgi:hypothetical protein